MSYRRSHRSRSRSWDRGANRSRSPEPRDRRYSPDRRDRYDRDRRSKPYHSRGLSNPPTDHPDANPGNNLYVNGIPRETTETELNTTFSEHGNVTSCRIILDPITKQSRGFGFVTFETGEEADKAIAELDGSRIGDKVIKVEKSRRKQGHDQTPGTYFGPNSSSSRDHERDRGSRRRRTPSPDYNYRRKY